MRKAHSGEEEVIGQNFEDPKGDEENEDEVTDPQEVFDDWMFTLTIQQRKMSSVFLYESFRNRQQMSKMDAAQKSASITG